MGCFRRAEWRSGLTYKQTCRSCGTENVYMDNILDFRPWYPDGFVYCTRCKSPLRHSELYAIDAPPGPVATSGTPAASPVEEAPAASPAVGERAAFCASCGRKFASDTDNFCAGCGTKRE